MEIYTLGTNNKPDEIIEGIESFIWKERFSSFGDFELEVKASQGYDSLFTPNKRVIHSDSDRVMKVDFVEKAATKDGKRLLKVKGRSMEIVMLDRIARPAGTVPDPYKWVLSRTPTMAARTMYNDIAVLGIRSSGEVYPDIGISMVPEAKMIPENPDVLRFEIDPKPLYDAVKEVADSYDFGFKIVRNPDTGALTFRVYTGRMRTTTQTQNTAVLFSPQLDNVDDYTLVQSNSDHKTHCLVFSPYGVNSVNPLGSSGTSGYNRKTMMISIPALEGTPTQTEIDAYIRQKAREALAGHRSVIALDAEISEYSNYKYNVDYAMGDIVEVRGDDGHTNEMRVTEQVFVLDGQGQRSYPTLSLYMYVQPGSWSAWEQNKTWAELTTEEWRTMP